MFVKESEEDMKKVIESLSGLRYELQTDKPYKFVTDNGSDAARWNQDIKDIQERIGEANATWFKGPWLFGECYLYRRIREAMLLCSTDFKMHDPFAQPKLDSCVAGQKSISALIAGLTSLEKFSDDQLQKNFHNIMQVNVTIFNGGL